MAHFSANHNKGLFFLQTAFIISFMLTAPLFGYLGDRYSRRLLMILAVLLWSCGTLAGSFVAGNGNCDCSDKNSTNVTSAGVSTGTKAKKLKG